ncbi:MAG: hypothetical protein JRH15_14500 [Deltaproteobacteria bacterium]|nr:hypothetical protein [Deltaproteobacteria bacterium]
MMKKAHVFLSISVLASLLVMLSGQVTLAYWESEDGTVYVTGWAENLSSIRLEDGIINGYKEGEIQTFRNTLQIETNVKFSPNCEFFTIARGYYEGSWDIDDNLPDTAEDRDASHRGAGMDGDVDLREYYFTIRTGPLTLKLGRQQVIWGEADNIRMADIINPLDLSWHYTFESWEDIRIPLRMVNLMYEPYTQNQFRLQLIWIPEDFRPWSWAPEGGPWALPIPGLQFFWDQQKNELPDRHDIRNGEFGARVQATFGNWEFSIFDFYSRDDNFVYSFDPTHAPLPFKFEWRQVNVIGGTFNVFNNFLRTVFRGECAFTMNQPYTSAFMDRIIEKNTFAFMLGFDRPTMWPFLNRKSFNIYGQWFHKRILDHESDIVSLDMSRDETQNIISLVINTSYLHDAITPQFVSVADFSGNGFLQPSIKYTASDLWEATLSANLIWGSANDDGYYGPMRKNDEIYLRVRVRF